MPRVSEVRQRAQRRTGNLYDTWFTRRCSAYITAALIPLGVSPNTVSAANLCVGAAACGLVALGEGRQVAVGAALIHLYAVLDSVDGELARWFSRGSLKGMFLENWSAYLMIASFPVAVALHVEATGGGRAPLYLALVHAALARNAMPVARRVILGVMQASPAFARAEIAALPPPRAGGTSAFGRLRELVDKSILYPTNVWVTLSALLLLEQAAGSVVTPWLRVHLLVYLAGVILKELGIVAIVLRTDHLAREMQRAYGDAEAAPAPATRPDAPVV